MHGKEAMTTPTVAVAVAVTAEGALHHGLRYGNDGDDTGSSSGGSAPCDVVCMHSRVLNTIIIWATSSLAVGTVGTEQGRHRRKEWREASLRWKLL